MTPSLLDTDVLSEIIKGEHSPITENASAYFACFGRFTFSLITRYEILRGMKSREASAQILRFNTECERSQILPISDDVVVMAADLYAGLRAKGEPISDADLFIAATAMLHGLALVTNKNTLFERIPGLSIDTWIY